MPFLPSSMPAWRWRIATGVALSLLAIAWAYWPGMPGPFLFDDYGNLDMLGAYGRIRDWPTFLFYVSSGTADPFGRPLALLTFLPQSAHWPQDPLPFKQVNLIVHLLDVALLTWTLWRLQDSLAQRRPDLVLPRWAPVLAGLLWGAHPFFVSTTLYVVQREAMLPLPFVLLALLAWTKAVHAFDAERDRAGWAWALVGTGIATVLGALAKANGLLAPMLAGLAYLFCLRPPSDTARARADRAALVCLAVPTLLIVAYLVTTGIRLWSAPLAARDWTLPQRLLTEPRVVWDYIGHLIRPRAGGGGLFVEDFAPSRDLLTPGTTLPALLALIVVTAVVIARHRRWPLLAFAWLFFLAGHLLEGTTVPLELYFEHRNYVPATMLAWPLAVALLQPGTYRRWRLVLTGVLICTLLLLTHERATIWGDRPLLAALSAAHEAGSPRAQVAAAREEIERGRIEPGLARLRDTQAVHPASVDLAMSLVGAECSTRHVLPPAGLLAAQRTLATAREWNYGLYDWMQEAVTDPDIRTCKGFGLEGLTSLVDAAERNRQSRSPMRKRGLWHVRGRIALARRQPDVALHWFDAVIELVPDADYALVQAALLGSAGAPELGVRHLDAYRHHILRPIPLKTMADVHTWLLRHYGYYDKQIARLRTQLEHEAGARR